MAVNSSFTIITDLPMTNSSTAQALIEDFPGAIEGTSILLSLAAFTGLCGNGLLLVALVRLIHGKWASGRRSVVPNIMLLFLTSADLLVLVVVTPTAFASMYQIIESETACRLINYASFSVIVYAHLLLTIGVPVERYVAVCCLKIEFKRKWGIAMNCTLFLVSLIINLSQAFSVGLRPWPTAYGALRCACDCQNPFRFGTILLVFALLPLVFMVVVYSLILHKIWVTRRELAQHSQESAVVHGARSTFPSSSEVKQFMKDTHLVNVMFIMTAIYVLLWLPPFLMLVDLIPFTFWFRYMFLIINAKSFVVFGIYSPKLRSEMLTVLKCPPAR